MDTKIALDTNIAAAASAIKKCGTAIVRRTPGDDVFRDYNEIDVLESPHRDARNRAKLEMWISKGIGTALVKTYPGRHWAVMVDLDGKMVVIIEPDLNRHLGYHISMENRTLTELSERAKIAAGEILERFGISRAHRFDSDAVESLDRDFKDEVISNDATPELPVKKVHA